MTAGEAVISAKSGALTVGPDGRLRGALQVELREAPASVGDLAPGRGDRPSRPWPPRQAMAQGPRRCRPGGPDLRGRPDLPGPDRRSVPRRGSTRRETRKFLDPIGRSAASMVRPFNPGGKIMAEEGAKPSLDEVRWRIDAIDTQLHALIDERAALASAVAEAKARGGRPKFRLSACAPAARPRCCASCWRASAPPPTPAS
jgi:hypothetical protein